MSRPSAKTANGGSNSQLQAMSSWRNWRKATAMAASTKLKHTLPSSGPFHSGSARRDKASSCVAAAKTINNKAANTATRPLRPSTTKAAADDKLTSASTSHTKATLNKPQSIDATMFSLFSIDCINGFKQAWC